MTTMFTRLYGCLFAALLVFAPLEVVAEPFTYSAKEIRGQVVDDATGAPLEGAVIVAQWQLSQVIKGWKQDSDDALKTIEAVTDKEGKYVIPGWGPKLRPLTKHLEHYDPLLCIFKSGYYPARKSNEILSKHNMNSLRTSQWDGQVIRLKRFTGKPEGKQMGPMGTLINVWDSTLEEYTTYISHMQTRLGWGRDKFNWKSMPHMVIALKKERERLASEGLDPKYNSIDSISPQYGSEEIVEEFLKGYEQ